MAIDAYLCEGIRTPIGRFGGVLSAVRPDDLAAAVIRHVASTLTDVASVPIDDVILGCANQAGEDNRNVARMAALLAGLPVSVPGVTVNRLCASGLEAIAMAARAIKCGEADLIVAGGVESMSRAPFVLPKAESAFSRNVNLYDTTIGWRFINPVLQQQYGTDSMPETAENVAAEFNINRQDQDEFAFRSQQKAASAIASGRLAREIIGVSVRHGKSEPVIITEDEHPRTVTVEKLATLPASFRVGGSVTAGNASGVNDGACAMLIASGQAVRKYALVPKARIAGSVVTGVEPRVMGIGPAPASKLVLRRLGLSIADMDVIELNEAFAAQALATLRELGVPDDADHVNPNGGAIALGHPLGMSGARVALSAAIELNDRGGRYALCTLCIGVGQGMALVLERI